MGPGTQGVYRPVWIIFWSDTLLAEKGFYGSEACPKMKRAEVGGGCRMPIEYCRVMPAMRVTDLDGAIRFFTGLLGFQVAWRTTDDCADDGNPRPGSGETAMLEAGGVALLLSTGSHLGGPPAFTGVLYFQMQGVSELYQSLLGKVDFAWHLEQMPYGTLEFGVRGPDSYTLAFSMEAPG